MYGCIMIFKVEKIQGLGRDEMVVKRWSSVITSFESKYFQI